MNKDIGDIKDRLLAEVKIKQLGQIEAWRCLARTRGDGLLSAPSKCGSLQGAVSCDLNSSGSTWWQKGHSLTFQGSGPRQV